ncbi:hypothetical protein X975_19741, partial [Stegodyphus mimosarum]
MACASCSVRSFLHLAYDQEMKRLQKLLEEVLSDEDSIKEELFSDSDNEDIFSDHQSESEECDFSEDIPCDKIDYFIGKDKTTKWQKEPFRVQRSMASHNIIKKNCLAIHIYLKMWLYPSMHGT